MRRVRVAPSPTGTLHIGNALSAVANRGLGDWMLLRIDDTDAAERRRREEAILEDLRWLGVAWDEGPVAVGRAGARKRRSKSGRRGSKVTLRREDGSATYHLASVVDDIDFGITHVIRGNDHRPNEALHRSLTEALGAAPPEYIHHGLILGADGKKISKRAEGGSIESLREDGIPAEAVRAYLAELGLPRHDVHLDLERVRSLRRRTLSLAGRQSAAWPGPVGVAPALRGVHDLNEARALARTILDPPTVSVPDERETLERFKAPRARRTTSARTRQRADPRAEGRGRAPAGGRRALTGMTASEALDGRRRAASTRPAEVDAAL
jgi:hypothetical protein